MKSVYWTGGATMDAPVSGSFRDALGWSSGKVPNENKDVTLGGQGYTVTLAAATHQTETANSLLIGSGVKFQVIDSLGSSDPRGQTTLALNSLDDKGALVLAGGQITAGFATIEQGASLAGWGSLNASITSYGRIIASAKGDGVLHTLGGSYHGALTGNGELDLDATSEIFTDDVSVAKLRTYYMYLDTDLNLRHTDYATYAGVELQGHTLTLGHSLLVGAQFNFVGQANGTVHTIGDMVAGGSKFFCAVQNDGLIEVRNEFDNQTIFAGQVTGTGTISADDGAHFYFSEAVQHSQSIQLHGDATITLDGQSPGKFDAAVSGFDSTDHFDFSEIRSDPGSVTLAYAAGNGGGVLTLHAGDQTASIHLVGSYQASGFEATSDGDHGILIGYHAAARDMATGGSVVHV